MRECECIDESASSPLVSSFNLLVVVLFLPLLSLLGISFNLINIRVYSRRRSSAAIYLTALSCSDVGVCAAGLLVISADSMRAYSHSVDQLFVFVLPRTIPLGLFFQMLSVYVTVLAALDCFLSVRKPGGGLSARPLVWLVLSIAAYNVIQFWELEAVECQLPSRNISVYELCPSDLRLSEPYVIYYKGYAYAVSMAFLPFFLLSAFTVAILYQIRRRSTRPLLQTDCCGSSADDAEQSNPTVLLLVILLFLFCNITSLLVNVFEMLEMLEEGNEMTEYDSQWEVSDQEEHYRITKDEL